MAAVRHDPTAADWRRFRGIRGEKDIKNSLFPTILGRLVALASTLTAVCVVSRWESGPFEDLDSLKGVFLSSKATEQVLKLSEIL